MSMTWTQFLLSELAEEAVEVAKASLKCQQLGIATNLGTTTAILEVRREYYEMLAITRLLDQQADVTAVLGEFKYMCPVTDENQSHEVLSIITQKIGKVCYDAMLAHGRGNLTLAIEEFYEIRDTAVNHGAKCNLPYIGNLTYKG